MLTIAVKAARRAGNIINRGAREIDLLTVTSKGPKDFVSEVDREAERAIVEVLLASYPDHAILAEEGTAKGANAEAENVWIIDPLDGTTNFLHGFPQYCVSIALSQRGQITQGVVYDPIRNDLFTATRGRGAFLNDRRIRVSKRDHMRDCLIGTGFPFRDGRYLDTYLRMMKTMIEQTAGLRRPGAAALDLAYVAAGFYDGFWEVGLNPWDVAAGSVLIQEAGGLIGDLTGEGDFLHGGQVIAATPKIFAQMVAALAPFRADPCETPHRSRCRRLPTAGRNVVDCGPSRRRRTRYITTNCFAGGASFVALRFAGTDAHSFSSVADRDQYRIEKYADELNATAPPRRSHETNGRSPPRLIRIGFRRLSTDDTTTKPHTRKMPHPVAPSLMSQSPAGIHTAAGRSAPARRRR